MCGISGGVSAAGDDRLRAFVGDCRREHAHRGPDDDAERLEPVGHRTVILGHRRLAVVDVSRVAAQPMQRGGLVVTYNGEIYNHVELRAQLENAGLAFRTRSDTEVLLAAYEAWGEACVSRLRGMFAFALLDLARRRLLLVRDRFGVKPLYYWSDGEHLVFSSTAHPVARFLRAGPNPAFVARGLRSLGFDDDTEATQYAGPRAIRPGHLYRVDLDQPCLRIEPQRYYDLESAVAGRRAEVGEVGVEGAVADCRALLTDAIRIRLRADVPIAVSLSGGLDSSLIAALSHRHDRRLVGYCFGHPEQPETEAAAATALARHLGMELRWVDPAPALLAELYWAALEAQDAPFSTGSIVAQYAVYQAAHRDGFKVVLGGQGGDEAFLGYRKALVWSLRESIASRHLRRVGGSLADLVLASAADWRQAGLYARVAVRRADWGAGRWIDGGAEDGVATVGDVAARQIADVMRGGLPTLLRYEDRNSMANSVESRLPFMDHHLMEWAIALPTALKVRSGFGKWILRRIAADLIPASITATRAKRGFDVATGAWLAAGLGRRIRGELRRLAPRLASAGIPVTDVDRQYPDGALARAGGRLTEATGFIWLGRALERGGE